MDDGNVPALSYDLGANIGLIKSVFKDDETLIVRYFENLANPSIKCCAFYIDGMVDNKMFSDDIVKPVQEFEAKKITVSDFISVIAERVISSSNVTKTADVDQIIQAVVYGDSVLLVSGSREALILNTKGWTSRAIKEPDGERVLRGPREGFNESLIMNLTMLRRRLRTQALKMKFRMFGARSQTKGCLCYLDGVVNADILAEVENRLGKFSMDGVLDVEYISEFICDEPYSPIETIGNTERPDIVAAKLLEGRIALFLDGTPVVLTMPKLLIEHFQSNDDYYLNYFFASISRILRIIAFFITTSMPAVYVSLTTFHQEMLPTALLMSVAMARQNVPLPTVLEVVIMLIAFEILRETGIRMPGNIGQALSIVGALVIGQAAVAARLVSAPMIVIVAVTGITGLLMPRLKSAIILIRFIFLILSSVLGLYGYIFGLMALLLHLLNMRSFGIPVMTSVAVDGLRGRQDIYLRFPWWAVINRPKFMSADKKRSNSDGDPA
jgi:spore germination protein KA